MHEYRIEPRQQDKQATESAPENIIELTFNTTQEIPVQVRISCFAAPSSG